MVKKNLPAMQDTWLQFLDWEDPLEEGMATYSSILAWRIPWTEEPGGLHSKGLQRVGHDLVTEQQQLSLIRYVHNSELPSVKLSILYTWT